MKRALTLIAVLLLAGGSVVAASRPNVVILLADDSGWGDYGYNGNTNLATPNLDALELSDNTIVLYFSDNGPNGHRWTGGLKGTKGTVDEGGVRSVFLLGWPAGGIRPGPAVSEIAGAIDL